jgi:hypothetical protein
MIVSFDPQALRGGESFLPNKIFTNRVDFCYFENKKELFMKNLRILALGLCIFAPPLMAYYDGGIAIAMDKNRIDLPRGSYLQQGATGCAYWWGVLTCNVGGKSKSLSVSLSLSDTPYLCSGDIQVVHGELYCTEWMNN